MLEIYNNDIRRFFSLMRVTVATVAVSLLALGFHLTTIPGSTAFGVFIILLAFVLLTIGSMIISKQRTKLEQGQTIVDEMSIAQIYKAGYYTMVISFMFWMFMGSFVDSYSPPRFLVYLGLLFMVVCFLVLQQVFRWQQANELRDDVDED
ncbi:MAG: hypothetical protein INQ03_23125 [Candidatus Heimdallarchaeota archaeon]|nr:hypothetical protein [Candidatus Heimdallarchaeota archaeon]